MPSHRVATAVVAPYLAAILPEHPEVVEAGVTFDALFAYGKEDGPAPVKLHGYPCAAIIKINDVKARLRGLADATITFDAAHWETLSERKRRGLVSHEVRHVVILRDKQGQFQEDDAGRPKIKNVPHDWQLGGFRSIAAKYGEDAPEVVAARAFRSMFGQLLFAWGDDNAPADEVPALRLGGSPSADAEDDEAA